METRSRCREGRLPSATCDLPERAPPLADRGATPAREIPQKEALMGATAVVGGGRPSCPGLPRKSEAAETPDNRDSTQDKTPTQLISGQDTQTSHGHGLGRRYDGSHHHECDLLWARSPIRERHIRWQIWHSKLLVDGGPDLRRSRLVSNSWMRRTPNSSTADLHAKRQPALSIASVSSSDV